MRAASPIARLLVLARVALAAARDATPGVVAGTLTAHLLVVFAVVQLDAVIDWGKLSVRIGQQPVLLVTAALAGALWVWGTVIGRALKPPVWLAPLPLGDAERGAVVASLAAIAVLPAGALAWLVPGRWRLLWAAGVALWALPVAIARAARRSRAVPIAAATLALLAGALWRPLPLLAWLLALPLSGRLADGVPATRARLWSPPAPRSRVGALVWRDGLTLARCAPGLAFLLLFQSVPAWAVERAATAHHAGSYAAPLLAFGAVAVVAALGRVARHLGGHFDPPHWPLTALERVTALVASAWLGLLPVAAAVVGASPPDAVVAVPLSGALAAGAAWTVAADRRGMEGRFAWWALGATVACLALGPWAAGACGALGFAAAWRALIRGRP